jgi:hypothetical protein
MPFIGAAFSKRGNPDLPRVVHVLIYPLTFLVPIWNCPRSWRGVPRSLILDRVSQGTGSDVTRSDGSSARSYLRSRGTQESQGAPRVACVDELSSGLRFSSVPKIRSISTCISGKTSEFREPRSTSMANKITQTPYMYVHTAAGVKDRGHLPQISQATAGLPAPQILPSYI